MAISAFKLWYVSIPVLTTAKYTYFLKWVDFCHFFCHVFTFHQSYRLEFVGNFGSSAKQYNSPWRLWHQISKYFQRHLEWLVLKSFKYVCMSYDRLSLASSPYFFEICNELYTYFKTNNERKIWNIIHATFLVKFDVISISSF